MFEGWRKMSEREINSNWVLLERKRFARSDQTLVLKGSLLAPYRSKCSDTLFYGLLGCGPATPPRSAKR